MARIPGIRSVDFGITAVGEGVVHHAGTFPMRDPRSNNVVGNHRLPQLGGVDPFRGSASAGTGSADRGFVDPRPVVGGTPRLDDPRFTASPLVVSANCVRGALFGDVSHGLAEVTRENAAAVIASLVGLVRGYLITGASTVGRTSALSVTDWTCAEPRLGFRYATNRHVRHTERDATSLRSGHASCGTLVYRGKMSLSIEELQYLPLEHGLGRSVYDDTITAADGERVARGVSAYLGELADDLGLGALRPEASFVRAVRINAVARLGDTGVLLDDDALRVLVAEVRRRIETLEIRRATGYLRVGDVVVDHNDSKLFRFEDEPGCAVDRCDGPFARFYRDEPVEAAEHDAAQLVRQRGLKRHRARKPGKARSAAGDASG